MNVLLSDNEVLQEINDYPDHMVIHTCSAQTDDENDIVELKTYGKLIARLIRRKFPDSVVHSRLYYR